MPNIVQVLKEEIARIARKQSRSELAALKKAITRHRSDIAVLKRGIAELTRQLRSARRQTPPAATPDTEASSLRFRAQGLASHRRRLGLSAADLGLLLGVSGQTIYLWETGRARPRPGHMPAIAALRSLGRRQAEAVLANRR
jgi:DNA-binding XRE family transcriptional regulator